MPTGDGFQLNSTLTLDAATSALLTRKSKTAPGVFAAGDSAAPDCVVITNGVPTTSAPPETGEPMAVILKVYVVEAETPLKFQARVENSGV